MKLFHFRLSLKRKMHDLNHSRHRGKFAFIALLIMVSAVYGLSLRGKAEEVNLNEGAKTHISDNTTPVTSTMNYDGVSIHAKIENTIAGMYATVKRGEGQKVNITLTVNNGGAAKTTDVRFTLPAGFTYDVGSANIVPTDGTNVASPAGGVLKWTGYSAPVGESLITFKATLP